MIQEEALRNLLQEMVNCPTAVRSQQVGAAGIDEDDGHRQLDKHFAVAIEVLSDAFGPAVSTAEFPGFDVEKCACWQNGDHVAYLLLSFQDNTRIRTLSLGVLPADRLRLAKPEDWWSRPAW